MLDGVLLKGYSSFYYVFAEDRVWECSLRGRFRIRGQEFLPGDRVKILPGPGNKATIEAVEPRRNSLIRPSIANVDQALIVFALTSPEPDLNLLDRILIQVTAAGVDPILVLTKLDLCTDAEKDALNFYQDIGYPLIKVSSIRGDGIEQVKSCLKEKISVLAGPSGVGKSSLMNALCPDLKLKTGELSRKLSRGRHTTRHVELMVCAEGLVADTPGFSSLYLPAMKREELSRFFPEFEPFVGDCRFSSCLHAKEPDCAVKKGVERGQIPLVRYEHYQQFLHEVIAAERRY